MAICTKNTNIPLLAGSIQIRNIKFTADRKTIQVLMTGTGSVECTNDIDTAAFLGVKIVNNNLVFTDAISGLNNNITSNVSDNPSISIAPVIGGGLNIIGIDDTGSGFSVPQINVRYDSATNSVRYQI